MPDQACMIGDYPKEGALDVRTKCFYAMDDRQTLLLRDGVVPLSGTERIGGVSDKMFLAVDVLNEDRTDPNIRGI